MNKLNFHPSAIAIFLTEENLNQLSQHENLAGSFGTRIQELFSGLKIFVNQESEILKKYFPQSQNIFSKDELGFLKNLTEYLPPSQSGDSDIDEVFFVYCTGIYPLLDLELTKELLLRHKQYLSQYSYSENLPTGIVPYFLSREFVLSLPPEMGTSAHEYLLKNINNYDVEIFYSPPDLRQFRLDFSLSDARSSMVSELILKLNSRVAYTEIFSLLEKSPDIFRCAPSYLEIEIFRGCELKCSFCPRQFISNDSDGQYLQKEFLNKIISDFTINFPVPFTVCFGGMGEPLLHPDFISLADLVLGCGQVKELIVESALYPDIERILEFVKKLPAEKKKKLSFIVNLSALDERQYSRIYGKNLFHDILKNIDRLVQVLHMGNLHVQIIKLKEVENQIEDYFNFFEEKKINVILQKYNRYAELMPEKRVSDLTPIKREFCWHLARDLYIKSDGKAAICRQDFQNSIGDLNNQGMKEIWERGLESFSNSLKGNHSTTKAPCLKCDEWYTFNA